MSQYTENALGFNKESNVGRKIITKREFSNITFSEFVLGPVKNAGDEIRLSDVAFLNCNVMPGPFVIRAGVSLERVIFDAVDSSDSMVISANSVLNSVVVKGSPRKGGIWIRPDEIFDADEDYRLKKWVIEQSSSIEWMLDISAYDAEHIEIMGMPIEKVKFNPEKHVAIFAHAGVGVSWDALGIPRSSFWRISHRRLKTYNVESGIFGLPLKTDEIYEETIFELEKLRAVGFL